MGRSGLTCALNAKSSICESPSKLTTLKSVARFVPTRTFRDLFNGSRQNPQQHSSCFARNATQRKLIPPKNPKTRLEIKAETSFTFNMSTPADFSTYHPMTRSEELRWSLDPIVQKKLDDGRMDYTILAERDEALALIRELASCKNWSAGLCTQLNNADQRFDNVTTALLALVKPEWKREAQLIIDQFKP